MNEYEKIIEATGQTDLEIMESWDTEYWHDDQYAEIEDMFDE